METNVFSLGEIVSVSNTFWGPFALRPICKFAVSLYRNQKHICYTFVGSKVFMALGFFPY